MVCMGRNWRHLDLNINDLHVYYMYVRETAAAFVISLSTTNNILIMKKNEQRNQKYPSYCIFFAINDMVDECGYGSLVCVCVW